MLTTTVLPSEPYVLIEDAYLEVFSPGQSEVDYYYLSLNAGDHITIETAVQPPKIYFTEQSAVTLQASATTNVCGQTFQDHDQRVLDSLDDRSGAQAEARLNSDGAMGYGFANVTIEKDRNAGIASVALNVDASAMDNPDFNSDTCSFWGGARGWGQAQAYANATVYYNEWSTTKLTVTSGMNVSTIEKAVRPMEGLGSNILTYFDTWNQGAFTKYASLKWQRDPLELRVGVFDVSGRLLNELGKFTAGETGDYYIAVAARKDINYQGINSISGSYGLAVTTTFAKEQLPDLAIQDIQWNGEGGAKGTYSIQGAPLDAPAVIGLYWSEDGQFDSNDKLAAGYDATELQPGSYPFDFTTVTSWNPPGPEDSFLLAVIDIDDRVQESNEKNNIGSLQLITIIDLDPFDISVELQEAFENVFLHDAASSKLTITNHSPFPVQVEYILGAATDLVGASFPDPIHISTTIPSGGTVSDGFAFPANWEWIPEENPLLSENPNWLNDFTKTIYDFLPSVLGKVGDATSLLKTIVNRGLASILATNLYRTRDPVGQIAFYTFVTPVVAGKNSIEKTTYTLAQVSDEKLKAFDNFVIGVHNLNNRLVANALVDALSFKTNVVTNIGRNLTRRAIELMDGLDAQWKEAVDPPDPEFESFVATDLVLPDYVLDVPIGPLRIQESLIAYAEATEKSLSATIDKKDGAVQAGDATWRVEQLVEGSNLAHRNALYNARANAVSSLLTPLINSALPSAADAASLLHEYGLSDGIRQAFLAAGYPSALCDAIDAALRNATEEDFSEFDATSLLSSSYLQYATQAEEANALLSEAIRVRVQELGYSSRDLTSDEASALAALRERVASVMSTNADSSDVFSIVEEYLATARSIALDSNNFAAVEEDLNLAYLVPVNPPLRFANFASWRELVDGLVTQGAVDSTVAQQLNDQAAFIENLIVTESWSSLSPAIDSLLSYMSGIQASQLSESAANQLLAQLSYFQAVLFEPASVPTTAINDLPEQVTADPGEAVLLASQASVVESGVGNLAGGWLSVQLNGDDALDMVQLLTDNSLKITSDLEVEVADEIVGKITSSGAALRIELRANASAEAVSKILQHIILQRSDTATTLAYSAAIQIADGAGGLSTEFGIRLTNNVTIPIPSIDSISVPRWEGTNISVDGSTANAGVIAGNLTYQWTVTKTDSAGAITTDYATGEGAQWNFLPDDNGEYVIQLIVVSEAGLQGEIYQEITVANRPPRLLNVTSNHDSAEKVASDGSISLGGSYLDPGVADTHTVKVDWGDGKNEIVSVDQAGDRFQGQHVYTTGGMFVITVIITDSDGGTSSSETTAYVTGARLHDGLVQVVGTSGNDSLLISQLFGKINVTADFLPGWLHTQSFASSDVDRIVVFLGDGNDLAAVTGNVQTPVLINGGAGNDALDGGSGDDVLIGGDGDDLLHGGKGQNLLIGGLGEDLILGNQGDDLLIGGYTAFDNDSIALQSLLTEWSSSNPYQTRVENLRGTNSNTAEFAARQNGDYFLIASGENQTVFDDDQDDHLIGNGGRDWYFANLDDEDPSHRDSISGLKQDELVDLLNAIM